MPRAAVVLASVLALLLAACAAPPPGPPHEVRELSLQGGFITGTLKIPMLPAGPKPVVVRPIVDDELLLERGIAVVHFQTHWQMLAATAKRGPAEGSTETSAEAKAEAEGGAPASERVGRWILSSPKAETVGRAYFALIAGEADAVVPALLDHLETLPGIDRDRMGIGGSSTAGFLALEAFQRDSRLGVAVVRVACGDYLAFLRDSSLALNGEEQWLQDGEIELAPDYAARLREREAIASAHAFPPRPLLMLNGAADTAIPVACARTTAVALAQAYESAEAPERFRFVVFDDRGHDLGAGGDREVLAWWERWLGAP